MKVPFKKVPFKLNFDARVLRAACCGLVTRQCGVAILVEATVTKNLYGNASSF